MEKPKETATWGYPADLSSPNPADEEKRKRFGRYRDYFCKGLAVIVVVLIIICIICGITYKKEPQPKFQLSSLSVSPFNLSPSLLTANWNVTFFVQNPHSYYRFSYERVDALVLYRGVTLSTASIMPFYQDEKDRRFVNASSALSVGDSAVNDEIIADWMHGAVNFTVSVDGTVRRNSGSYEGYRDHMTVSCGDVTVGFSRNTTVGAMVGGSRECNVHIKY